MSLLQKLLEKNALIVDYSNEFIANQAIEPFIRSIGESKGSVENRRVDGCCGNSGCTCNGGCKSKCEIDEVEKITLNSIAQKPRFTT